MATNRRRAAHKNTARGLAKQSTVSSSYPPDDPRRSHGARRVHGSMNNGPVGDHGNKGKPPKYARLVDGRDRYGQRPRSHKRAGWA